LSTPAISVHPWQVRQLIIIIIIIIILADSYINAAAREPGAAAELAVLRKEEKYAELDGRYIF